MTAAFRTALTLAAALAFAAPALADPAEDASTAFEAQSKGDFATALRLYRLAALAGNTYAQGNLGTMYHTGQGTAKDFNEAMRWYKMAAAQNYADAQFNIGIMYEQGEGVKQDFAAAAKSYALAAEQGYVPAESALGTLYASGGPNFTPDRVQAYKWLTLASAKDANAKRRRDTFAQRMTPEQKAQGDKLVADFKPKEPAKK